MKMKYKVIATWGAQKYTTELGEFSTMEEAIDLANNWQDAPKAKGILVDIIEVIQITQKTVYRDLVYAYTTSGSVAAEIEENNDEL